MIEFFAGDAHQLGVALGHVDLSMHIGPEQLDGLCAEVARLHGGPAMRFSDAVGQCVAGDETLLWVDRDWSADVMSDAWVEMSPSLSDEHTLEVAERWLTSLGSGLTAESAPHVPEAAALYVAAGMMDAMEGAPLADRSRALTRASER